MALFFVLQVLLTTLLSNVAGVTAQFVPSTCTDACWLEGLRQSGCLSGNTDSETACMCTSEENYDYFYDCNLTCMYEGVFTGLSSAMECISYKRARDAQDGVAYDPRADGDWQCKRDAAAQHTISLSVSTEYMWPEVTSVPDTTFTITEKPASAGPHSTILLSLAAPTTFETRVKRVAAAQIAALTPYETQAPKPKPQWSSYHAVSFPGHTIWYCGVPGSMCAKVADDSDTQPDAFSVTELASQRQVGTSTSAPMVDPSELATYGLLGSITGTTPLTFGPPIFSTSTAYLDDRDIAATTEHVVHGIPTPVPNPPSSNCEIDGVCGEVERAVVMGPRAR